jgi:AraC-like DNA-binding protein
MGGDEIGQDAPVRFEISTDAVSPCERFDFFCDLIAARVGIDAAENWSDDFSARMSSRAAGAVNITNTACSPASWSRTRHGVPDGEEWVMLRMLQAGSIRMVTTDIDFLLRPGMVALFPSTIGGEMQILEPYRSVTIKAPRVMVETLMPPGQLVTPTLFAADDPVMSMLTGYVGSYLHSFDGTNQQAGQVAGKHIGDLIALALGAHHDAQVQMATDGGLRAARIDAILKAIANSHASLFISPASIGGSLGISERHVHRLLEDTNRTFYEHLLEARLCSAHRLLTDPRSSHLPITEVAERAGFSNVSYFNRVFRQRFGDTPSGVRRKH